MDAASCKCPPRQMGWGMTEVKATGVFIPGVDEKCFTLSYKGETVTALRSGTRGFSISLATGTKYGTLKMLKGEFKDYIDAGPFNKEICENDENGFLWDCTDPCALLAYLWSYHGEEYNEYISEKVMETLDAYGYLEDNSERSVDARRIDAEFKRRDK